MSTLRTLAPFLLVSFALASCSSQPTQATRAEVEAVDEIEELDGEHALVVDRLGGADREAQVACLDRVEGEDGRAVGEEVASLGVVAERHGTGLVDVVGEGGRGLHRPDEARVAPGPTRDLLADPAVVLFEAGRDVRMGHVDPVVAGPARRAIGVSFAVPVEAHQDLLVVVGVLYAAWVIATVRLTLANGALLCLLSGLMIFFFGLLVDQISAMRRERHMNED